MSPAPFSIIMRKYPKAGGMRVLATRLGFESDYKGMFSDMKILLDADLAVIRDEGKKIKSKVVEAKPAITEKALREKIKRTFIAEGSLIGDLKKINKRGVADISERLLILTRI